MPSFRHRSYRKELLDRDDIPFNDIKRNMLELDSINRRLGGHAISLSAMRRFLINASKKDLHIVEIGCGGGDNLRAIRKGIGETGLQFTGVDINPNCVAYAKSVPDNAGIEFLCADYKSVSFSRKPDLIFSSLFCHHFNDDELVFMLQWMRSNASLGFFINDLHRHPLAYYSISLLTRLFSSSYLVKNDAPLSVLRGFRKKEWQSLGAKAGIHDPQITWRWAFRWLITSQHPWN